MVALCFDCLESAWPSYPVSVSHPCSWFFQQRRGGIEQDDEASLQQAAWQAFPYRFVDIDSQVGRAGALRLPSWGAVDNTGGKVAEARVGRLDHHRDDPVLRPVRPRDDAPPVVEVS